MELQLSVKILLIKTPIFGIGVLETRCIIYGVGLFGVITDFCNPDH